MTKQKYTDEDFQTDVDWLVGHGLDQDEAESFIKGLLNKEWSE